MNFKNIYVTRNVVIFLLIFNFGNSVSAVVENESHLNCIYEKSKSLKDGYVEKTGGSKLLIINFLKNSAVSLLNDKNGQIFLGSFSKSEINVESRGDINSSPQTIESFTINRFTGEFENTFRIVGYDKTIS